MKAGLDGRAKLLWSTMETTKQKLTPYVRYVTMRVGGRPIYGYIWMLWLQLVYFLVFEDGLKNEGASFTAGRNLLLVVMVGAAILFLLRIGLLLGSPEGRAWLCAKYVDGRSERVTIFSVFIIWMIPLMGMVALANFHYNLLPL